MLCPGHDDPGDSAIDFRPSLADMAKGVLPAGLEGCPGC